MKRQQQFFARKRSYISDFNRGHFMFSLSFFDF